jgi:hypothetical protein
MNQKNDQRKQRNPKYREEVIMPVPVPENQMPDSYSVFLIGLKNRIRQERLKAVLSANAALVMIKKSLSGYGRILSAQPEIYA